jgi:hypothetical protein
MGVVKDYYFILGVRKTATARDITEAYELVSELASRGEIDPEMMEDAREAYEFLSDEARRRDYDISLTPPPPLYSSGNAYQYTSAETPFVANSIFHKMKKKHRLQKTIKRLVTLLMLIGCLWAASRFMPWLFVKESDMAGAQGTPPRGNMVIRDYRIKTGALVWWDGAKCHAMPYDGADVVATMKKNTIVLAEKDAIYENGRVWYYVSKSRSSGWMRAEEIRVLKF